jgi:hypothetical protein
MLRTSSYKTYRPLAKVFCLTGFLIQVLIASQFFLLPQAAQAKPEDGGDYNSEPNFSIGSGFQNATTIEPVLIEPVPLPYPLPFGQPNPSPGLSFTTPCPPPILIQPSENGNGFTIGVPISIPPCRP